MYVTQLAETSTNMAEFYYYGSYGFNFRNGEHMASKGIQKMKEFINLMYLQSEYKNTY